MAFGYLLRRWREEKGLSLRKLGHVASVDHAYLQRLEHNSKENPGDETVTKLGRALGLTDEQLWLFHYAARFRQYCDQEIVEYLLQYSAITLEEFSWAVALKFRRSEKVDCPKLYAVARQIVSVIHENFTDNDHPSTLFPPLRPPRPPSKPSGL